MFHSHCIIKLSQLYNYPWGKKGKESAAARYCAHTPGTDFRIENDKEYAEVSINVVKPISISDGFFKMWMGTYPTTPSYVLATGQLLQDVLNAHKQELIGKAVLDKFGVSRLIALFQILSIAKALPLQIHPNKDLASKLHAEDSNQFSDPNHKPEIAISLTDFELFVGFKPLSDIQALFSAFPFLQKLISPTSTATALYTNETLRAICHAFLTASPETVESITASLSSARVDNFPQNQQYISKLLPRLQAQYSSTDPGTLVALLLMNFLSLPPSSCVYVPADCPHAYLSGDIIESMARSDNVLNTGFCPRADRNNIDLFTSTLTFASHAPKDAIVKEEGSEKSGLGRTVVFRPPMSEMSMLRTRVQGDSVEKVRAVSGPSIMIVTHGEVGKMVIGGEGSKEFDLKSGYIFFIGQGVDLEFRGGGEDLLEIYRAYVE
ncbi:MAG: hypothetical protein Q9227_001236 [Pyrenula ochraceoflavens]